MSQTGRLLSHFQSTLHGIAEWITSPRRTRALAELPFRLIGLHRRGREIDPAQIERILVVRLDEIGDVVTTIPFLRELRRMKPETWITLVVKPATFNLVECCPHVNEVLTYDWYTRGHGRDVRRHGRALKLAWQHLWRRRFDLAILPRWDVDLHHASFLAYFSGARCRLGFADDVTPVKRARGAEYDQLLTHTIRGELIAHEVERSLALLTFLGGSVVDSRLEMWTTQEDEEFAKRFLGAAIPRGEPPIALGPGAGAANRIWPLEKVTALAEWLVSTLRTSLLVVGGEAEEPYGEALRSRLGPAVVNAAGRTTLRQSGALLRRCRMFIGNDSGPMHLAAAASIPVVEVSCHPKDGSPSHWNSPVRFRPWGVPHVVVQPEGALAPCSNACEASTAHCIAQVGVERVQMAVAELLPTVRKSDAFPDRQRNTRTPLALPRREGAEFRDIPRKRLLSGDGTD